MDQNYKSSENSNSQQQDNSNLNWGDSSKYIVKDIEDPPSLEIKVKSNFVEGTKKLRTTKPSYEKFTSKKYHSFGYFALSPETGSIFDKQDVEKFRKLIEKYKLSITNSFFLACVIGDMIDRRFRFKNIMYGLTYQRSIIRGTFKFLILPSNFASSWSHLKFGDIEVQVGSISDRYNIPNDARLKNWYDERILKENDTPIYIGQQLEQEKSDTVGSQNDLQSFGGVNGSFGGLGNGQDSFDVSQQQNFQRP